MKISIIQYPLTFKRPATTSRGILRTKDTWFLKIFKESDPHVYGLGEINMFQGLSDDDRPDFYEVLKDIQRNPSAYLNDFHHTLENFPSIRFGIEMAMMDLTNGSNRILFPSNFTKGIDGIPINGLIWMGEADYMNQQIKQKIESGFRCLKLKIGAIHYETELAILKSIRKEFGPKDLELRVDANGAFSPYTALHKLDQLSKFNLHSIEQPIRQGQIKEMSSLCKETMLPIALDEELIGVKSKADKAQLLSDIQPQYIIIKPSLLGGFKASEEWIEIAHQNNIGWWITSALESNIGLNAIAQWTYPLQSHQYQGLGTGQLFTNNISSALQIQGERLVYLPGAVWEEIVWNDEESPAY